MSISTFLKEAHCYLSSIFLTPSKEAFRYLSDEEAALLDKNWDCSYCRDSEKQRLVTHCKDPRQHTFHYDCVIKWLKEHNECYFCRHEASYNQLLPWKERITHSPLIKKAHLIITIFRMGAENIIIRRLYIGGALGAVSLTTNTPHFISVALFISSTGFSEVSDRCHERIEILSAELKETNKTIQKMEKIKEDSMNRIKNYEPQKDLLKELIFQTEESRKECKKLEKQIKRNNSLVEKSSLYIVGHTNSARITSHDLFQTKAIKIATAIAQYGFFILSVISFYRVFFQETSLVETESHLNT